MWVTVRRWFALISTLILLVGGVQMGEEVAAASQDAIVAGSSNFDAVGTRYAPPSPPHAMTAAQRHAQVAKAHAAVQASARQHAVLIRSSIPAGSVVAKRPRVVRPQAGSSFYSTTSSIADADGSVLGRGAVGSTATYPAPTYVGAAVQGEQATFTQDVVAVSSTQSIHLVWQLGCGDMNYQNTIFTYSSQFYDLGQTVTPPVQGTVTNGPSFSFTTNIPPVLALCFGARPQDKNWFFTALMYWVPAGTPVTATSVQLVDQGSATQVTTPIPAADESGCGCSGNGAGFPQQPSLRGDPVNTATGAFSESFTDATLPSGGAPLELARSYTSSDTATGALGTGWRLPWAVGLSFDASGNATFTDEEGKQFVYTKNSDGSFTPPTLARSSLVHNSDGTYTLATLDHQVLVFSAAGQVLSQKAANGRGLTFTYSGGKLATVTDAASHTATLSYTGSLLTKVTFSDGRWVGYGTPARC